MTSIVGALACYVRRVGLFNEHAGECVPMTGMHAVMAVVATITAGSVARADDNGPIDGNKLLAFCTSSRADYLQQGMCRGYVHAVVDGPPFFGNFPDRVVLRQVVGVVVRYLREHPERRHEPAQRLAVDALKAAFPDAVSR